MIIKRPILLSAIIAVAGLIAGGYFYFTGSKQPVYDYVVAKKGDLVQKVSVSGRIKPEKSVDLAFEQAGKISVVYKKVGDKVFRGEILMRQDNSELLAKLSEAKAIEAAERSKLEELERGSRKEEIKIKEVQVQNAKTSLEEAKKNLNDKLRDAYTKSDDAVRNKADQFFNNPKSSNPELNILISDQKLKITLEQERLSIESLLNSWSASLETISSSKAKENLNQIKLFLDKLALAVNSLSPTSSLSQTTIDGYKSDVSIARTNINTAIANLTAAQEKLSGAESALTLAENELILKKAGATQEELDIQKANLEKAKAGVKDIQSKLAKTVLRSPISGVVAKQNAEIGEIVGPNDIVASIISENDFKIEANVPEVDIAKIKIKNMADVTLDAYGSDVVFKAEVVKIDPAETIIEGVATYKITLRFIDKDRRIKPGMSADLDILTAKKENVISVPGRAVITKNGDKFVRILEDGKTIKETKVLTGLRGSDGNIEIIEGVKEGDKVIIFIKE